MSVLEYKEQQEQQQSKTNTRMTDSNKLNTSASHVDSSMAVPPEKKTRKRNRAILSCKFCRERKSKCNQERPVCSSCSSRGLTTCSYTEDAGNRSSLENVSSAASRPKKIKRLSPSLPNDLSPSSSMNYSSNKPSGLPVILPSVTVQSPGSVSKINGSNLHKTQDFARDGNSPMMGPQRSHIPMQSSVIQPIVPQMNTYAGVPYRNEGSPYVQHASFNTNETVTAINGNSLSDKQTHVSLSSTFSKNTQNTPGFIRNRDVSRDKYNQISDKKSLEHSTPRETNRPTSLDTFGNDGIVEKLPLNNVQTSEQVSSVQPHQIEETENKSSPSLSACSSVCETNRPACCEDNDVDETPIDSGTLTAQNEVGKCSVIHLFNLDTPLSIEPQNPLNKYLSVVPLEDAAISFGVTSFNCWFERSKFMNDNENIWNAYGIEKDLEADDSPTGLGGLYLERHVVLRAHPAINLLEEIVSSLPRFSVFRNTVADYFQTGYHSFIEILDEKSTLKIVDDIFEVDGVTDVIKGFNVTLKSNFFLIGIVLIVFLIVRGKEIDEFCFIEFFCHLRGISCGYTFSLRKLQFMLLNYFYRHFDVISGEDTSKLFNLSESIATLTTILGFRGGVHKHYSEKNTMCGSINIVENLWIWSLYADLVVSFGMGKPLSIAYGSFDEDTLKTTEKGRIPMIKRFLYLGRKIVYDINKPRGIPDIDGMIYQIDRFFEGELKPLEYYTDEAHIEDIDIFDYVALISMISFKQSLLCILMKGMNRKDPTIKHKSIRTSILCIKILKTFSAHCVFLKRQSSESTNKWNVGDSAKHVYFWLKIPLTLGSLFFFYDVVYDKGKPGKEYCESSKIVCSDFMKLIDPKVSESEIEYDTLQYSMLDVFNTFISCMEGYYKIIKGHFNTSPQVLYGSYNFKSMEFLCRSMFMIFIERSKKKNLTVISKRAHEHSTHVHHHKVSKTANGLDKKSGNTKADLDSAAGVTEKSPSDDAKDYFSSEVSSSARPPVVNEHDSYWDYNALDEGDPDKGDEDLFGTLDFDFSKFFSSLL